MVTIGMPVRGIHIDINVDNMGMHINLYNMHDLTQMAGGTDFGGGMIIPGIAGRRYPGAVNIEVRTGIITEIQEARWFRYTPFRGDEFWVRNFHAFFVHNHKVMHDEVEIWKCYIEPIINGDIARLVDNWSEKCL